VPSISAAILLEQALPRSILGSSLGTVIIDF